MRLSRRISVIAALAAVALGGTATAQQAALPQLRSAGFVALNVVDLDRMAAFYKAIGFAEDFRQDTATGVQLGLVAPPTVTLGSHLLLIVTKDRKETLNRGTVLSRIAWAVQDVAALCSKATAVSGKACSPRDNTQNRTRIAVTEDPDGNRVEFIENY